MVKQRERDLWLKKKYRKKYRKWNEESMLGAMRAVTEGMGINRAAVEFGLPKSTLKDRISGRVEHGTNPGRVPYLSASEEQELVNYIITCADIGYPKRRHDVLSIVCKTLEEKNGAPVKFNGKGWWLRFMQRWPKLALRRGDPLAQPRANAVNAANIKQYYDLLKETRTKKEWHI